MTLSPINTHSSLSPLYGSPQDPSQTRAKKSLPVVQTIPTATLGDKRQSALHLVTDTLTKAYEKIASRGLATATAYGEQDALANSSEPMTATKAANTILGFIERRLQLDVADGATKEQLKARLEAGLEGFKKGFAEAADKLKALSMLSPEVEADIGDTYKQVMSGLDALRAKFIEDAAPSVSEPRVPPEVVRPAQINNIAIQEGLYEYAEARDFRFELITQDGDKVSIRAASSLGVSVSAGRDAKGIYGNASQSSSSSFELAIDGDLSESELKAINQLLGRVDSLAGQFYAGNLDKVFDKALSLGYDDQQIASYSLNLSQVQIQQVAVAYSAFAPEDEAQAPSLANQLAPVGDFIKEVFESINLAAQFFEPKDLLLDLSKKMAEKVESENALPSAFAQFLERLLALNLEPDVSEPAGV
jgi:hypothetical protein